MRMRYYYGTPEGGRLAAKKNKEFYGNDFYKLIGRKGGKASWGGGQNFASTEKGPDGLTNAQRAGKIGGSISRKTKDNPEPIRYRRDILNERQFDNNLKIVHKFIKKHYACLPCHTFSGDSVYVYKTEAEYRKHFQKVHAIKATRGSEAKS